jgi:hypothetical protein
MWKAGKLEEEVIYLELRKSGRVVCLSGARGIVLVRSCFPDFHIGQVMSWTTEIQCGKSQKLVRKEWFGLVPAFLGSR